MLSDNKKSAVEARCVRLNAKVATPAEVAPAVVYAVADRLAQTEGQWRPFDRSGWRSLVYPDPNR